MKRFILLSIFLINMTLFAQQNKQIKEAQKFQNKLNKEFADKEESPLLKVDLKNFKSLDFFEIDSVFIVKAKLKLFKNSKPFKMQTTTNRLPIYKVYASATFKINNKEFVLHIYQSQKLLLTDNFEDLLFLPFTDKTNGDSSYGGGRYIDLDIPENDTIIINFNKAYNPYCAYNSKYSCPIPPSTNHLNVEVNAGVKAFDGH
ncbi:DUF1684 domain-containing protein [Flavobacteriaceae bacterium AH-315-O20]|nr:DUF1684 domain-containing protein [Flavobacteriaceae bacterium AH-315-O20]